VATGTTIAFAESIDKLVDNFAEIRPTVLVAVPRVFLLVYSNVQKMLATHSARIRWLARVGLALARKANSGQHLRLFDRLIRFLAEVLIFSRVRQRLGGRLRFAIVGGSALPGEVAEFVDGIGISVYEGYGLTEAAPIVAANSPGHRKFGTAGKPIPGVQVTIDTSVGDEPGQGEIVVHGPNIMRGYHNCPEETRATLDPDGGLHTGDLGFLDDDGYLHITGRIKEQYKLFNGKYVSPAALEDRLKLSPFIAEIMIHGANRSCNIALVVPDWDYVHKWAESRGIQDTSTSALISNAMLREQVAKDIARLSEPFKRYELIRSFVLLPDAFTQDSGMLTPSLKLKRRNIVKRWGEEIERLYQEIGDEK
jgi:long-chain acyl-CoA synthetase